LTPALYEHFDAVLKAATHRYSTHTIKTLRSSLRRMRRDLDDADLGNTLIMSIYRFQMPQGTRNIYDVATAYLRPFTPPGVAFVKPLRKPSVVYPHPLSADVMELGAVYGNERLPEMVWGDVEGDFRFDEMSRQSRARIFDWFATIDVRPTGKTPLVPKDRLCREPMKLWQIEYIINSPTRLGKVHTVREDVLKVMEHATGNVVRLNASALTLRYLFDHLSRVGSRINDVNVTAVKRLLDEAMTPKDLTEVIEAIPTDPVSDDNRFW